MFEVATSLKVLCVYPAFSSLGAQLKGTVELFLCYPQIFLLREKMRRNKGVLQIKATLSGIGGALNEVHLQNKILLGFHK